MKIKISKYDIYQVAFFSISIIFVMLVLTSFVRVIKNDIPIDKDKIVIENIFNNTLLDEKKTFNRIKTHKIWKSNTHYYESLSQIEKDLAKYNFVKEALVYMGTKGEIYINVSLHQPVARVTRDEASDAYITEEGKVISRADYNVIRLLLITGEYANKIINEGKKPVISKEFLAMLLYVKNDVFLSKQIAQLDINYDGEITIYPLVGKQRFLFGKTINHQEKLEKFKLTYTKILAKKGWGYYNSINLKYKNQIVAQK